MYLRRVPFRGGYRYVLRESFMDDGCWKHRDIADLGPDPGEYIEYPGGNGFYFKSDLEDILQQKRVVYSSEDLEEAFLPFLAPNIRRIIGNFRRTPRSGQRAELKASGLEKIHAFDKRRVHFLRFGRIDTGNLEGREWKFLNILIDKSRDETEHLIEGMERELRPRELSAYIYTAFNLEAYFPDHLLRHHPAALDREKVDGFFLDEVCFLNQDRSFFRGIGREDFSELHPLLRKYVIIFFDSSFEAENMWSELLRERMRQRIRRVGARSADSLSKSEALEIMGISESELRDMSSNDLARFYRRRAQTMHPDKGGEHEKFLRLTEAYNMLLTMM